MEKLSDRWMFYCGLLVGMNVPVDDLKHIQDLIDAEEQGLLLKLPCKVGDKVYEIKTIYECDCDYDCVEYDHYKCESDFPCEHQYSVYKVREVEFQIQMIATLGKAYFLTKEEAEAKRKEMEGES